MDTLALGPFLLSQERFAILAGAFVFLLGTGLLASRVSVRFNLWSVCVMLGGLAAARLAHVVAHQAYFSDDPLRALAIWQGGFNWPWMLPVVALSIAFLLRTSRERVWAAAPLTAAMLAWAAAHLLIPATEPLAAPHMTLATLDGTTVDLSEKDGRPTVINLWATWCAPCRREMPTLAQAERAHPEIRFLFINQGEDGETVRAFLKREGLSFDHMLLDPSRAAGLHYRARGIPVTLFLQEDGRLAKAHTGEIAPERIDREIASLTMP